MVQWTLAICYFLHLVATIVWLGGLLLMLLIVWPATQTRLAGDQSAALLPLLQRLRKRLTPYFNLSLIVLLVTGLVQMDLNPHYDGLLQITSDWSRAIFFKHLAVLVMIGVAVWMQWGLSPALERAALLIQHGKPAPDLAALQRRERQLTALNVLLSVIVLLFTAIATAV